MPRYIDALLILGSPRPAADVVKQLSATFRSHGMTFLPDTPVIYHASEREPETASSAAEAWRLITASGTLGGTEYTFVGRRVAVFLYGTTPSHVDAIAISTIASAYLREQEFKKAYDSLILGLHTYLSAQRTIVEHELLSPDSRWAEVVARARAGTLQRTYSLDLPMSSREALDEHDERA